jgi:hypothetical protein
MAKIGIAESQITGGGASGGGSGTVDTGVANEIAFYASSGTTVSGDSLFTDDGTRLIYTGAGGFDVTTLESTDDITVNSLTIGLGGGNDSSNLAVGDGALASNTTGTANVGIGSLALNFNTSATGNLAVGAGALRANTTGNNNIAIGASALFYNDSGVLNVAIGAEAMQVQTTAYSNIAIGQAALAGVYPGNVSNNVAIGYACMVNCLGNGNVGVGASCLSGIAGAYFNVGIGYYTLNSLVSGQQNTCIGFDTGANLSGSESYNIYFNNVGVGGESNTIRLGTVSNQLYAYIFGGLAIDVTAGGAKGAGTVNASGYYVNGGPTWTSGSGAPSGTPATGSIYSNTTGGIGSSFYVYNGTAWVAVA